MPDDFIDKQIAALLMAVDHLEALNGNVHFYTDYLSQENRGALAKMWRETLHRCRELEKSKEHGKDTPDV